MNETDQLLSRVRALAHGQHGVITVSQARQLGLPRSLMRRMAAHGQWRPLARGTYWVLGPGGEPGLHARVCAAQLSGPGRTVATGPTAARLHQLQGVDPGDPSLHLACRGYRKPRGDIVYHKLGDRRTTRLKGMEVTTLQQTIADILLTEKRMVALSLLDSALHQRVLLPTGLAAVNALLCGRTGVDRARRLLGEGDGRAESPLETRNRLLCADHGMPPEILQWPLPDPATGIRYRLDAGYPSRWVGVEADGRSVHDRPEALHADRERQNALLSAYPGLIILRFTWRDSLRPERFLAALRRALARTPPAAGALA